jgi:hypothetical protein
MAVVDPAYAQVTRLRCDRVCQFNLSTRTSPTPQQAAPSAATH